MVLIFRKTEESEFALPFIPTLKISDLLDLLIRKHALSPNVRLLFNGKVLNRNRLRSLKDCDVDDNSVIDLLNYQTDNIFEEILEKSNLRYENHRIEPINASSEQGYVFKVTPDIIADATGAERPMRGPMNINRVLDLLSLIGSGGDHRRLGNALNELGLLNAILREGSGGPQPDVQPDPEKVKTLVEMGFTESKSKRALKRCRNNLNMAMEQILNTPEEESEDEEMSQEGESSSLTDFQPNAECLTSLMEMGFDESQSVHALRITNNNYQAACSYLLSNGNVAESSSSSERQSVSSQSSTGARNSSLFRAMDSMENSLRNFTNIMSNSRNPLSPPQVPNFPGMNASANMEDNIENSQNSQGSDFMEDNNYLSDNE